MSLVYKTFTWKGDVAQLDNPELRQEILQKCRDTEHENDRIYKAALQKRDQAKALIDDIVVPRARNRGSVPLVKKPESVMKEYKRLIRQYQKWLEKQQARMKRHEYKLRREQAQKELEAAGYVANEHYPASRAITTKKELLYQIEPGVWGNRMLPEPGKTHEREY